MEVLQIEISKSARSKLGKMPLSIQDAFLKWVDRIEKIGIQETRKGQRSARLNRAYRAIYIQRTLGEIMILEVLEINKHRY